MKIRSLFNTLFIVNNVIYVTCGVQYRNENNNIFKPYG